MKYIDADRLRAEIERQKRALELSIQSQGDYGQSCHIVAYENILSLIDSLQQEQPEVDLEKEMDRFFEKMPVMEYENIFEETYHMIALHFYELGLNARKEESHE